MEKKEKDLRKHAEERQPQHKKKFNVYSMDSLEISIYEEKGYSYSLCPLL